MKVKYIYHDIEELGVRVFTSERVTTILEDLNKCIRILIKNQDDNMSRHTEECVYYIVRLGATFAGRYGQQPYRVVTSLPLIDPTRELLFRDGKLYFQSGDNLYPYNFESCEQVDLALGIIDGIDKVRAFLRGFFCACETIATLYSSTRSTDARAVSLTVFQSVVRRTSFVLDCVDDWVIAPSDILNMETVVDVCDDDTLIEVYSYDVDRVHQECQEIFKHEPPVLYFKDIDQSLKIARHDHVRYTLQKKNE